MNLRIAFLSFALLVSGLASANSAESLYSREEARSLGQSGVSYFGPQSPRFKYDKRMVKAARIAQQRARSHSARRCWSYVKTALVQADVVRDRPGTAYAKQAGTELVGQFGFKRLSVKDPYKAPIGSVLVYGGRGAGHVEIRTREGFVSDFESHKPSPRPLIGVFVKPA